MGADHRAAAHTAAVWRETYPAGSTQSNMGAAYLEALAVLHLLDEALATEGYGPSGHIRSQSRALLTAAGWK